MRRLMSTLVALLMIGNLSFAQDEWKRAYEMYNKGDYTNALVLLEEAIDTHPDWWFSMYLRGRCQFELNKYNDALASFFTADTLEVPTDKKPILMYDIARTHMAIKDYPKAIDAFTNLISIAPNSRKFELYYNRGQCEVQIAKAAESADNGDKAYNFFSKGIVSFSEAGKFAAPNPRMEVEAAFQKAFCQYKIGNRHGTQDTLVKCISAFEDVLEKDQRHQDAHRFLIEVSFQLVKIAKGQKQEAEAYSNTVGYIDRYLKLWPNDAKMLNKKGQALQGAKRYRDAIAVFKKYTELKPKDGQGYFSLGSNQMAAGDYDDAIKSYEKAISRGANNNQNVYTFAAYSYIQQKNECYRHDIPLYEKAVQILEKGAKASPGNSSIKRDLQAKRQNLQILRENQRTDEDNRQRALDNIQKLNATISANLEKLARNREMNISQPTADLQNAIAAGQKVIRESKVDLEKELKDLKQLYEAANKCGGASATQYYSQMTDVLKANGLI